MGRNVVGGRWHKTGGVDGKSMETRGRRRENSLMPMQKELILHTLILFVVSTSHTLNNVSGFLSGTLPLKKFYIAECYRLFTVHPAGMTDGMEG